MYDWILTFVLFYDEPRSFTIEQLGRFYTVEDLGPFATESDCKLAVAAHVELADQHQQQALGRCERWLAVRIR